MRTHFEISEVAARLGLSERAVRKRCSQGRLPGARKCNKTWIVPITADARLAGSVPAPAHLPPDVAPQKLDAAVRKLGLITQCERYAGQHVRAGGNWSDAVAAFCRQENIPLSTFKRWRRRWREDRLGGLVDSRGGCRIEDECISPAAWRLFKSVYLDERQPTIKSALQIVQYENDKGGHGWKLPTYPTLARYVKKHIPYPVMVLHREGVDAYEGKCSPYIALDPDSAEPGEIWVGDHHQFNCFIRQGDKWGRPWITAWQDWRSREIVGRHISFAPNQTSILLAMKPGIKVFGPPARVIIDNGRDYDSQMWTGQTKADRKARKVLRAGYLDEPMLAGLYGMLQISVSFCIPYRAKAKRIERWFDTLDTQFTKFMATYTGKDSGRKPEDLAAYLATPNAIADADDLKSFTAKVDAYIQAFSNTPHTGVGMDGRTPAEVMATRETKRVVLEDSLDLLMRVWSGPIKVGKNGVRLNGVLYGQYDARLAQWQGRKVRAAYDPDDVRTVAVYDAETMHLITIAEQNQLLAYGGKVNEEALREAMRQQARAKKTARAFKDTAAAANMDLSVLAYRAMTAQTKPVKPRLRKVLSRPVATPMDGQGPAHAALERREKGKKAAGAESYEPLVFDWDKLRRLNRGPEPEPLKLFDRS